MKKPIAIIPARGNSKRIPKKNIIDFNGQPLIQWTIEAALQSQSFEQVFVSTDNEEIAKIARECGAEVPFLRDAYADDQSTVSQSTSWFVKKLRENAADASCESVVQLMANCPIRTIDTIRAFVSFASTSPSSVISVVEPKFGSPYWAMTCDESKRGRFLFEEYSSQRSQDLPQNYYPTGSLWYSSVERLIEAESFYSADYRVFDVPWLEAIDIDTREELDIAACLHRAMFVDKSI
ncbi:MAG: acylneuraminate cytidylyltransferase family protein [Agarilytica sp.]